MGASALKQHIKLFKTIPSKSFHEVSSYQISTGLWQLMAPTKKFTDARLTSKLWRAEPMLFGAVFVGFVLHPAPLTDCAVD